MLLKIGGVGVYVANQVSSVGIVHDNVQAGLQGCLADESIPQLSNVWVDQRSAPIKQHLHHFVRSYACKGAQPESSMMWDDTELVLVVSLVS